MEASKAFAAALWPVVLRVVIPSALGAAGTVAAVVWSDGFRAFCGVAVHG